jgi:hypothetical protein
MLKDDARQRALACLPGSIENNNSGIVQGRQNGREGLTREQIMRRHDPKVTAKRLEVVDLPYLMWWICRAACGGSAVSVWSICRDWRGRSAELFR